jgi:hypothetical protein
VVLKKEKSIVGGAEIIRRERITRNFENIKQNE